MLKKSLLFLNGLVVMAVCVSCTTTPDAVVKSDLGSIIEMPHRSDDNKARDQYRHPKETLEFFEVAPNHHVVEISPGRGWYTEILAPYLKNEGKLYLAVFKDDSEREHYRNMNSALKEKVKAAPEIYGEVVYTTFEVPTEMGPIAPDESVDRVLTFRNLHNWIKEGKLEEALKVFNKALKPGGVLGVVEHRLPKNKKHDPKAKSGYVREDFVIKKAKNAGFELVASSEINANPKDTADHPEGVWTLPPSLRLKDKDRAKYEAIGESDRMTLKFRKVK